jgi:hypothetical protein
VFGCEHLQERRYETELVEMVQVSSFGIGAVAAGRPACVPRISMKCVRARLRFRSSRTSGRTNTAWRSIVHAAMTPSPQEAAKLHVRCTIGFVKDGSSRALISLRWAAVNLLSLSCSLRGMTSAFRRSPSAARPC